MPTNHQTDSCISTERGALVFWAPPPSPRRQSCRVQIIDVFALQVASGYTRDPQGRLLIEAKPSVVAGRSWTLAKAAQLIRNDARPHRWVVLELNQRAWGLFWAGGGLQRCRELLADRVTEAEACSALVPATPEALLRLMVELAPQGNRTSSAQSWSASTPPAGPLGRGAVQPWKLVLWTSMAWLVILGATVTGFLGALKRQDRKLDLLIERSGPSPPQAPSKPSQRTLQH
jgi:hypothetical protein